MCPVPSSLPVWLGILGYIRFLYSPSSLLSSTQHRRPLGRKISKKHSQLFHLFVGEDGASVPKVFTYAEKNLHVQREEGCAKTNMHAPFQKHTGSYE
jgi:hypothetical protein